MEAAKIQLSREAAHTERVVMESKFIKIRRISSIVEMGEVAKLRYSGYKHFDKPCSTIDDLDMGSNCVLLVAESYDGVVVGTVRMLIAPGPIELDCHVNLERLASVKTTSYMEASRLVVSGFRDSFVIKSLLCKACCLYCLQNNIDFLVATATPRNGRFYSFLKMRNLGEDGKHRNPLLGNALHMTYCLKVADLYDLYIDCDHAYKEFMFHQKHDIDV